MCATTSKVSIFSKAMSLWVNVKRVAHTGFVNFFRNGFVSLASILVTVITLFIIGSVVLGGVILRTTLDQIKDKVDINVYFQKDAPEDEILALKRQVEVMPEVKYVEYISREQALANFRERNAGNALLLQAVEELDDNPLRAVLNIKAHDPAQYESISRFFGTQDSLSPDVVGLVEDINYNRNKIVIDKLTAIIDAAEKLGLGLTIVFIFLAVLVTFNTVQLAIYTSREEIAVMRLVGASNNYVRGPFVVAGAISGLLATLIAMAIFYPVTLWVSQATHDVYGGLNLSDYYLANFGQLFLILLAAGVLLGVASSYLAVKRYLKV